MKFLLPQSAPAQNGHVWLLEQRCLVHSPRPNKKHTAPPCCTDVELLLSFAWTVSLHSISKLPSFSTNLAWRASCLAILSFDGFDRICQGPRPELVEQPPTILQRNHLRLYLRVVLRRCSNAGGLVQEILHAGRAQTPIPLCWRQAFQQRQYSVTQDPLISLTRSFRPPHGDRRHAVAEFCRRAHVLDVFVLPQEELRVWCAVRRRFD